MCLLHWEPNSEGEGAAAAGGAGLSRRDAGFEGSKAVRSCEERRPVPYSLSADQRIEGSGRKSVGVKETCLQLARSEWPQRQEPPRLEGGRSPRQSEGQVTGPKFGGCQAPSRRTTSFSYS